MPTQRNADGKLTFSATRSSARHDYLRRLAPEVYRGRAYVHWTMCVQSRRTGWLTSEFHLRWREIMLHGTARHGVICPAYMLMPDHWHLLLIGISEETDQRKAMKFLRQYFGELLRETGYDLQKQAYDHVLREEEREKDAFASVAYYILANPERTGLANDWKSHPWLGAIVPGYPSLDPRGEDYWERFWKIHAVSF